MDSIDNKNKKKEGLFMGILYGLIPHIGCIAFIVFSVLGVTAATTLFKPMLLNPYFFHILIGISFFFATLSAIFYFKKQGFLVFGKTENGFEMNLLPSVFKRKWKYLLTLYGTTIGINLLLFMLIFPIAANFNSGSTFTAALSSAFGGGGELELSESSSLLILKVEIPCPGHAPLIIGELKGISGVEAVKFQFPNLFDVGYNPEQTSKEEIVSLDVFNTYKATVVNEVTGNAVVEPANNIESQLQRSGGSCCGGGGCGCGCGNN